MDIDNSIPASASSLFQSTQDSNPVRGRQKDVEYIKIDRFLQHENNEWQQKVAENFPYRLARLVHHNYSKTKRWYVIFYAWDVSKGKMVRTRVFNGLNDGMTTPAERIQTGNSFVAQINSQLRAGKKLGTDKVAKSTIVNPLKLTLIGAIEYVQNEKSLNGNRAGYVKTFATLKTNLEDWIKFQGEFDFNLKEFTERDALNFFTYLRDQKNIANKTINNYIDNLGIVFKFIEKQYETVWKKDPLRNIVKLPTISRKHAAFNDDQVKLIVNSIQARAKSIVKHRGPGYTQLELFISFIYYLLARPNEIMMMQVRDIHLSQNRAFVGGDISKNKSDEYVEIAPRLAEMIKHSGIMDYAPEFYIFGRKGVPSAERPNKNYFWIKHKKILTSTGLLKINPNFSLYSYKHSGAISLYKATKDIKLVQRQCRHKTLEQTNVYLRDLDLLSDYDQLKNYRGAL